VAGECVLLRQRGREKMRRRMERKGREEGFNNEERVVGGTVRM